jgi:hypothetical protein
MRVPCLRNHFSRFFQVVSLRRMPFIEEGVDAILKDVLNKTLLISSGKCEKQ